MKKVFLRLFELIIKKLQKKKQPTVKAENSVVIYININKG